MLCFIYSLVFNWNEIMRLVFIPKIEESSNGKIIKPFPPDLQISFSFLSLSTSKTKKKTKINLKIWIRENKYKKM